ncbi:M20/M25/M40 family metallo-hydrolase [Eggerthellaceae bacterium 3-80]|nr:M20/M25/M40 family metallo-hydrolase [bacterium D16-34]
MNNERLLSLFCELVQIESPSRDEAAMAKRCARELSEMGFSVEFDNSVQATGSTTGNLVAHLPGTCPGHIVLSAHMDTVQPCTNIVPIVEEGIVRSSGQTILSADDKAGIAAIFEAVRTTLEQSVPRPDITVVLTTCEELSLLGAGALDINLLPEGAPCFIFDADGAPGTVIMGAPCHRSFEAHFLGRAAHAGVEPEAGISAIQMAASAIANMSLGRLDDITTANVGVIEGGSETNVVADSCMIKGECRSLDIKRADACVSAINDALDAAADRFGGTVEYTWREDYGAVNYGESHELVCQIKRACKRAGVEFRPHISGGGADANILCTRGVKAITLGIGMTNFHSVDEFISVSDLQACARLAFALIAEAADPIRS